MFSSRHEINTNMPRYRTGILVLGNDSEMPLCGFGDVCGRVHINNAHMYKSIQNIFLTVRTSVVEK